jgi:beta-galactosidase
VEDATSTITVGNAMFKAVFSKTSGTLSGYSCSAVEMMSKPLLLNVFRLPTDNDGRQSESWDAMGLRKLSVKANANEVKLSDDGKTATITMNSTYSGKGDTKFDVSLSFIVCADGTIMVNSLIRPTCTGAIIPQMGFRLEMPAQMEQLAWFGRGPWDSYRDRKEACLPAIYRSTVSDQREDYILPQEHGTKQEVRWLSLSNSEGQGLLFVAPDQMAASAVHFRPEDNYTDRNNRTKHTHQFRTCTTAVVSLNAATRGLGNASCGPDVMENYELHAANTPFRFIIIPITNGDNIVTKARVDMPVCQPVSCERQTNGRIIMSTPTKNATIYYSIDGGEYQRYSNYFTHNAACTITAYSCADGLLDSPVTTYTLPLFISKSTWKLVSVDSQHGGNEARLAFDGNNSTFWHTEWGANEPPCPHTLVIDMVNTYKVTAVTYLARQDGNQNGMVKAYEVYLSTDKNNWGHAVATGELANTTSLQTITLNSPAIARYLKFVAKSEINGKAWTSAAEIGIEADADVTAIDETQVQQACINNNIFDLHGRRLFTLSRGLYIVNGKKIIH